MPYVNNPQKPQDSISVFKASVANINVYVSISTNIIMVVVVVDVVAVIVYTVLCYMLTKPEEVRR